MKYPSIEYFIFVILLPSFTTCNCTTAEQASSSENPLVVPNQITLSPVLPFDIAGGSPLGWQYGQPLPDNMIRT